MCGVVAILSKNKSGFMYKDKTIFLQMLISDMFRGMDSTGCFAVNKYGNLNMLKDACAAPFFINKSESTKFFNKMIADYHVVVGHNRKATVGQVTDTNAHPFIEGNICLIHNGTLTNHREVGDTAVDSHAICQHINDKGYKSALKTVEGAYSLIWYNAEEKNIYFCRNAERPLYMVETGDKIYLASEGKMLDWILDRNDIGKYTVQNVPTDKVFKFNMETRKLEAESKPKKASDSTKNRPHWLQKNLPSVVSSTPKQHTTHGQHVLTPSSAGYTASINTYTSGDDVRVRVMDFEVSERACKLCCETLDGYKCNATIWVPFNLKSQKEIDAYINAPELVGRIASISSKKGEVQLWLKAIDFSDIWETRGGQKVSRAAIMEAGGACYGCGTVFNNAKEVEWAEITCRPNGDIQYMLCESCADGHQIGTHGTYGGYC